MTPDNAPAFIPPTNSKPNLPSRPPKPSFRVNLLFSLGHIFGIAMLAIPPVGLVILMITLRKHKAYLKTFPNNSYQ